MVNWVRAWRFVTVSFLAAPPPQICLRATPADKETKPSWGALPPAFTMSPNGRTGIRQTVQGILLLRAFTPHVLRNMGVKGLNATLQRPFASKPNEVNHARI
jgi:hypothetical protein